MRGLWGKKWPPECKAVALSLQVPWSPPLPRSMCMSDLMQKCLFSCTPNSNGMVCAALGQGEVEGEILGFCSIVLSFTPRFPGTLEVCNALGMVLLCIQDSSQQGPAESASAESRAVLSRHEADIAGLVFLKKYVLKGDRCTASLSF